MNPNHRDAYYLIGVMNWMAAFQASRQNPPDTDRIRVAIDRGLQSLRPLLDRDASDTEAMLYTSLLLRTRATTASDREAALADTTQADQWIARVRQAGRPTPARPSLDPDQPPPPLAPPQPPPPPRPNAK